MNPVDKAFCPRCSGDTYITTKVQYTHGGVSFTKEVEVDCPACNGTGWVAK